MTSSNLPNMRNHTTFLLLQICAYVSSHKLSVIFPGLAVFDKHTMINDTRVLASISPQTGNPSSENLVRSEISPL